MPRIALIYDQETGRHRFWKIWLEEAGLTVDTIYSEGTLESAKCQQYDLVVPLITIRDYVQADNARMRALAYFKTVGTNTLTSSQAVAASSDKLVTAKLLKQNGIPHPNTVPLEDFVSSNISAPFVVKPRFGHGGANIHLVSSFDTCSRFINKKMLAQAFIENAECIRVIASSEEILSAYKKVPPTGEFIANVDKGAVRVYGGISIGVKKLARSAVQVLGGGLMGVDILVSDGKAAVLEANIPFGFDGNDKELRQNLQRYIQSKIQ